STRASDRNADIEIAVIDDVATVDRRVQCRKLLERMHGRLDEKAHEAELDAMLFFEALLVLVPKLDDRLHVDFVERRQNRGGRLRLHETFGNALSQARHGHTLLGTRTERGR